MHLHALQSFATRTHRRRLPRRRAPARSTLAFRLPKGKDQTTRKERRAALLSLREEERDARRSCTGPTDTTSRPAPSTPPRQRRRCTLATTRHPDVPTRSPSTAADQQLHGPTACARPPAHALHTHVLRPLPRPPPTQQRSNRNCAPPPTRPNTFPGSLAGPLQPQQVRSRTPNVPARRADSSTRRLATPQTQPGPHTDSCTHVR